jgi:mRNA interferase RelE/StbE
MKSITYSTTAQKQIRALDTPVRLRIIAKIEQYADNPQSLAGQVKQLMGRDYLRLRVGDCRVIFTGDLQVMAVIAIGHRKDIYS